jgi:virginiamycin B lyase
MMRLRHLIFAVTAILAALVQTGIPAHAQAAAALTGQVSSAAEGKMEGVLVSAKRDGATITVTVVSDAQGRYSFPAAKLPPGHYTLAIRAVGYDLNASEGAEVVAGKSAKADLALVPTKNLPAQLTNAEWLLSLPGDDAQKKFLRNCTDCHTLQRIVSSTHDAKEFMQVFDRMAGYYPGASPLSPQRLIGDARRPAVDPAIAAQAAAYLASVNLSEGTGWDYKLQTLPRPTGRATRVIITEYALPRPVIQPHDVIVDRDGMVWYSNFGENLLSRLDPKSGKVTEYKIPAQKPGFPTGTLDLESDAKGNLWIALMYQTGVAKFDRKTARFTIYPLPKEWQTNATQQAFLSPVSATVDGKVWVKNSDRSQILRLDTATGKYENLGSFKDPISNRNLGVYGIPVDHANNVYLLDFGSSDIGRIDAKTGDFTIFRTATPNSRTRRGRVDAQDRLWAAEYGGDAVAMLDPKSGAIKEWPLPEKWSSPYDVVADKNGEVWTGSIMTDRVSRLDPATGAFTEYLLPTETNIRRVFVDNSTTPVTFWAGSNHGAAIVKLEPLD